MKLLYKLYKWSERKVLIFIVMASLSGVLGLYAYGHIYKIGWGKSILYTLELFAMDVKHPAEVKELIWLENENSKEFINENGEINGTYYADKCMKFSHITHSWKLIYIAGFLATLTLIVGVFLLLFRSRFSTWYRHRIIKNGEHTIVVGLGRNSRFFINSMLEKKENEHKIIAFETDKNSPSLAKYENEKISIVVDDVKHMMKSLNLKECKNIFISTGSDKQNIYYALEFIYLLRGKNENFNKLILHIENRTLRNLYADGNILSSKNINIRIFSYYKESARLLFQQYPLEGSDKMGEDDEIIESGKAFAINIVGNSELVVSVVMEACRLAHYPKGNRLTINCIDSDIASLEKRINYAFPEIKQLEQLNIYIEYINLDKESLEFYKDPIWQEENLNHIILCDDEVEQNISVSTRLREITYLRTMSKTQVNIASMNHIQIASKINKMGQGEDIYSFARADEICSVDNLLDNYLDRMGEMISYLYGSRHLREQGNLKATHGVELNSILSKNSKKVWNESSIYNKRSSIGEAIHIETKLKILGLKSRKTKNIEDLTRRNSKIFNKKLEMSLLELNLKEEDFLQIEEEYRNRETISSNRYFPRGEDNIFEALLNMEHNRWMAVLILMDNIYDKEAKDKNRQKLKVHHLLKSFKEFETAYEKSHIANDINAILNIPLYLAKVNCEIIDLD